MLYNNAEDLSRLNEEWTHYLNSYGLDVFPQNIKDFIKCLEFISCEDKMDHSSFNTYYYHPGTSDDAPEFIHEIRVNQKDYKILKFSLYNTWFIDEDSLRKFLHMDNETENRFYALFDSFHVFERLKEIRLQNRLLRYKKRLIGSINVKDVAIRNEEYYLILGDGTEAKLTYAPE